MSKKNRQENEKTTVPTEFVCVIDRSGSMTDCKDETIKGFNAYIKELCSRDKARAMRFTLTQFDTRGIDIIHDAVPLKDVKLLTSATYQPRGGTPLYDAMGQTIRATETKATGTYKVLFVTLTDGLENSSREWTSDFIKVLIRSKEDQAHWTFAYIGVGLQGWAATSTIAMGTSGASNVLLSSHQNTAKAYTRFAGATHGYACSTGNVSCSAQNLWGPNATTEEEPLKAQTKK